MAKAWQLYLLSFGLVMTYSELLKPGKYFSSRSRVDGGNSIGVLTQEYASGPIRAKHRAWLQGFLPLPAILDSRA